MVLHEDIELPTIKELHQNDVNLSSAHLMAAAPYLGKYCEHINNEFMLCRQETNDPRACLNFGKLVTRCAVEYFWHIKKHCRKEHDQYANCVDKSSGEYRTWPCRKTHAVYQKCVLKALCMEDPGLGYHCRGRIHKSKCREEPEEICPCVPRQKDITRRLPECKERPPARFGSRNYWMTE